MGYKRIILGSRFQLGLRNASQHLNGIMKCLFPQVAIKSTEKINGFVVPGPKEIVRNFTQAL